MSQRKIVFSFKRALGDCLLFTAGTRDFKLLFPDISINVDSNFPELWQNNPYIDRSIKITDPGVEYYKCGHPNIQCCNSTFNKFIFGHLFDMIVQADANQSLGISLGEFCSIFSGGRVGDGEQKLFEGEHGVEPFISWRNRYKDVIGKLFKNYPDIHLTEEERRSNIIKEIYGVDQYWVIAPGGKRDCTCKIWDWSRFQDVINFFKDSIKFVVIGTQSHLIEKLDGVIDLTDKLNYREILSLIYNADGCVSGVSFLMHAAAGLPKVVPKSKGGVTLRVKPCVSIYGGREPVSYTGYEGHQILHTAGVFDCCDCGGCWQSRVTPINKDVEKNNRLCHHPETVNGRIIPACMGLITSFDVIRSIEKYYEGNILEYKAKPKFCLSIGYDNRSVLLHPNSRISKPDLEQSSINSLTTSNSKDLSIVSNSNKEINVLASLKSQGGGEQSVIKIVELLRADGWKVNFFPWGPVHDNYSKTQVEPHRYEAGMLENYITPNIPLLFYANDNVDEFCNQEKFGKIIDKCSSVIIAINYINGRLPKSRWLSSKVRAIIFQNQEKMDEFIKDALGFDHTDLISLFGAIDLDKFIQVPIPSRKLEDPFVILKSCTPDYRKYVTVESVNQGEKRHVWQKCFSKEADTSFYSKLLKDLGDNVRFEFMEAHPELANYFSNETRMVFHKWNSIPVDQFLSRGHCFLYRSSNAWRDNYPRVVAEALAAGLPVLSEPRDGTLDRIKHGDSGFYVTDYDSTLLYLKALRRKEDLRFKMGEFAKSWASKNLDPRRWVSTINSLLKV